MKTLKVLALVIILLTTTNAGMFTKTIWEYSKKNLTPQFVCSEAVRYTNVALQDIEKENYRPESIGHYIKRGIEYSQFLSNYCKPLLSEEQRFWVYDTNSRLKRIPVMGTVNTFILDWPKNVRRPEVAPKLVTVDDVQIQIGDYMNTLCDTNKMPSELDCTDYWIYQRADELVQKHFKGVSPENIDLLRIITMDEILLQVVYEYKAM